MSRYVPAVATPPLGKLYYDSRDVRALKSLVAIRMTVRQVDVEVVVPSRSKKGGGKKKEDWGGGGSNGNPLLFTAAGGNVQLRDPFAIAWFLANYDHRSGPDRGLPDRYGAQIVQWNSFSVSEVVPHLTGLLVSALNRSPSSSKEADSLREKSLSASLDSLNDALKGKRFLVGDKFTLADVCVAADLVPVLDPEWVRHFDNPKVNGALKKHHVYLCEWYTAVASRSVFKGALAELKLPAKPQPSAVAVGDHHNPQDDETHKKRPRTQRRRKPAATSKDALPVAAPVPRLEVAGGRPLKVLCLHGYRQNGEVFRKKIGSFRKLFGTSVDFTFLSAPHSVVPMSADDVNQDQRGWWFSREDGYFKSDDASDCDKGLDASLELIRKTLAEAEHPFDGILGFSQGAALAALLCLLSERRRCHPASGDDDDDCQNLRIKFVMLFAAFPSSCSKHAAFYDRSSEGFRAVSVPSLHVVGAGDKVISSAASEGLLGLFEDPAVVRHHGGHFVPSAKDQKLQYFKFLYSVYGAQKGGEKDVNENPACSDPKEVCPQPARSAPAQEPDEADPQPAPEGQVQVAAEETAAAAIAVV